MENEKGTPRNETGVGTQGGFNFGSGEGAGILAEKNAAPKDGGDYAARIAQLERELQSQRVESGRLRKMSDEMKALREENAKLKAEAKDYLSMIPENLRDSVDADQAKAFGAMVDAQIKAANAESLARERARDEENNRYRMEDFERRIETARPGFMKSIGEGGDKYDAWMKWTRVYGASVRQAYSSCDIDGLCSLIDTFLSQNGVQPRVANATLAPRPGTVAGTPSGVPGQEGRTYTFAEYSAAMRDAGEKVRSGQMDVKTYRGIMDELASARDQGRVRM